MMMMHNGDHLQYELDNVNVPKEERSDWPLPSFDAMDWAKAFNKRNPSVSVDDALSWFACALMRGYDEARQRAQAPAEPPTDFTQAAEPSAVCSHYFPCPETQQCQHCGADRSTVTPAAGEDNAKG